MKVMINKHNNNIILTILLKMIKNEIKKNKKIKMILIYKISITKNTIYKIILKNQKMINKNK